MLVTGITTICTDKRAYRETLVKYPLASKAFDASLTNPKGNYIVEGLLSLSNFGGMAVEDAKKAQAEVFLYENDVFSLNPVFEVAFTKNCVNRDLEMLSGYDLEADSFYYNSVRNPRTNATRELTPERIQELNAEQKLKSKVKEKHIPGFNADVRELKIKSEVATSLELASNPYGSSIPTFRLVDPRFAVLLLTADKFGINSAKVEERIGALNLIAQILLDTYKEIQQSVEINDEFKEHLKIVHKIKEILKPLFPLDIKEIDLKNRVERNAKSLYDTAMAMMDEGLKMYKELLKAKDLPIV